ncbi:NAD(P)-binding protein [Panus rudis PR-1116 ss-1]|nr:NAD(P)-binding protein [Panus rudis PR-1116 ss-1]
MSIQQSSRIWLVTGASSGFGYEVTKYALSKGDKVVAATRNISTLEPLSKQYPTNLLAVRTDVRKLTDIQNAFTKAKETFGRLDVVFSNAGYTMLGEVEGTPEEHARDIFETNFWGALHVQKEAVRFFREVNPPDARGGRIIQNSSASAIVCFPGTGLYNASKHAIDAATESLALELDPAWNIKISLVLPAMFETPQRTKNLVVIPPHPAYQSQDLSANQTRLFTVGTTFPNNVETAVDIIYKLSELKNPPMRLALGEQALGAVRQKIESLKKELEQYEGGSRLLG